MELTYKNANIVLEDEVITGTLKVKDGVIADVSSGNGVLNGALDCEGDLLLPGLVELHTDHVEQHMMPRPGVHWPPDAALLAHDRVLAGAGITTVFDAICIGEVHSSTGRVEMLQHLIEGLERHAGDKDFLVDHRLHLRCEVSYPTMPDMLDRLIDHPLVSLLSVMDHTPGQRQFVNFDAHTAYYQGKYNMSDAELEEFVEQRLRDHHEYSDRNRRHTVAACRERTLPLASHDDATAEHVEEAVADGIVIAEFPTTLEAAKKSHQHGMAVLMGAPNIVRGKSSSGNISARELAAHKVLDILSSDYVPSSLLFAALLLEEVDEAISLPQAVKMVTKTPASHAGLDDRGEIAQAKKADILRVRKTSSAPVIRGVWREGERIA